MRGLMPSAISRRTGGPKRRRSSSFSIAFRRFSASSSSTSTSSLRVTRNVWCSCTTMPGNSCSRCSEMTSSTGTNDIGPFSGDAACTSGALGRPDASTAMNRGSSGGTLTRAKCSLPVAGLVTTTARLSDSPEMYGNGCAGSTASGVSTGKICRRKNLRSRSCSLSPSSSQRTSVMPSCASAGLHLLGEHRRVAGHQPVRLLADRLEDLPRGQPGRGRDRDARGDAALEAGHPDHEELVEVGREDRQEPHPLQQRDVRVLGQLEHPLVERQPGELAVEEPVVGQRLGGVDVLRRCSALGACARRCARPGPGRGRWRPSCAHRDTRR